MQKYDLVLKNGLVHLPNNTSNPLSGTGAVVTDIAIKHGKIAGIGKFHPIQADEHLDLTGHDVLPGLIDTQVHFREPGLTHKEDIYHGTKGAVLGGITGVFEMPNTNPATTSKQAFEEKMQIAKAVNFCNYAFYMGACAENTPQLGELETLPGCCGVKVFMGSSTGNLLVSEPEQLEKIILSGKRRMAIHCEFEPLLKERKKLVEANPGRVELHPDWRNEEVALKATEIMVQLSKKHNRPVHILHVSTKQEMDYLRDQKIGDLISVETTPQHLTLSAPDCYDKLGTLAQMNPPIRTKDHTKALWQAVLNGTVDIIGSDHAPHTLKEKLENTYPQTPSGMPGVQTSVALLLNHVNNGKMKIDQLIKLMCLNPCRLFNIKNKGAIKLGYDADLTIVNLNQTKTITNDWIASKSNWTPFNNLQVQGWPTHTIINGQIVMANDQVLRQQCGNPYKFEF